MEIEKEREQIFIATVCPICGFCKDPKPNFCLLLYDSDGEQFIREIASKIGKLRDVSSNSSEILSSFEGFNRLFCRNGKCTLYDKQCELKLSTRVACYKSFVEQNGIEIEFNKLATVYRKWAGIKLTEIGKDLDQIIDIDKPLSRSQRKKLRKSIKKARKKIGNGNRIKVGTDNRASRNNAIVLYKGAAKKKIETLFFCNSNSEWKGKISHYLTKNG